MAIIFKLTNTITNKHFIGFTEQELKNCLKLHKSNAFNKNLPQKLYVAIREFGWDNFSAEILEQNEDIEYTKNILQPEYITKYNSYEDGYNMTFGGSGSKGVKASDTTKQKMSETHMGEKNAFFGKTHTEEFKNQMSEAVKASRYLYVGEKAPFFGQHHTEEAKKAMGEKLGHFWKITYPDGKIEIIHNLKQFCRDHNLTAPLMIAVVKGFQHHHKGFKCEKADKEPTIQENLGSDI